MSRFPTFHVLGLHHTICDDQFSACAFTGKIRRLPAVLHKAFPARQVIEYGVEGSDSEADEHVVVRTKAELLQAFGLGIDDLAAQYAAHWGNEASIKEFEEDLIPALRRRVDPGDFILHPFGPIHRGLLARFPEAIHVESGIGYEAGPFGAYRIFETDAWRHWHFGRYNAELPGSHTGGPNDFCNTFVAANYYDPQDWPLGDGEGDYVLFAGRVDACKGIGVVAELARRMPMMQFQVMGGPESTFNLLFRGGQDLPNVTYLGTVKGRERANVYGAARCVLMPTRFCEPFGGVAAEALLCGTPVLAPPAGAFTDGRPVIPCRTLGEYEAAIQRTFGLDVSTHLRHRASTYLRHRAIDMFSYEAVAKQYSAAFEHLAGRP